LRLGRHILSSKTINLFHSLSSVGQALGTVFGMNSTLNQQLLPSAADNDDTHTHKHKQHETRVLLNPVADATHGRYIRSVFYDEQPFFPFPIAK
jgi:hypothetical protein